MRSISQIHQSPHLGFSFCLLVPLSNGCHQLTFIALQQSALRGNLRARALEILRRVFIKVPRGVIVIVLNDGLRRLRGALLFATLASPSFMHTRLFSWATATLTIQKSSVMGTATLPLRGASFALIHSTPVVVTATLVLRGASFPLIHPSSVIVTATLVFGGISIFFSESRPTSILSILLVDYVAAKHVHRDIRLTLGDFMKRNLADDGIAKFPPGAIRRLDVSDVMQRRGDVLYDGT